VRERRVYSCMIYSREKILFDSIGNINGEIIKISLELSLGVVRHSNSNNLSY
jgi:hypothetical protein